MTELTIMLIVWAVIFALALMAELLTEALVSVWFCVGAIVAFAITFIPGMPYWGEIIVFVGVSLITFLVIRPILQKRLVHLHSKTNVDTMIGKKGIVIKRITSLEKGEVKINDIIWNAIKRDEDDTIEVDSIVEVISIQGNKLLVKKSN